MSQILSQLTTLSLQVEDMKKDKGKDKIEDIWCVICRSKVHDKEQYPLFHEYLASGSLSPLKSPYPGARYAEIDIALVSVITWKSMFRHQQICIAHFVSP
jgi:hypothetical protein